MNNNKIDTIDNHRVIYINHLPRCPYCKKETRLRSCQDGLTFIEDGRNIITSIFNCSECDKNFTTYGNNLTGFYYTSINT